MALHQCQGGCHYGNLRFNASLSSKRVSFNPRACDCDYCTMHVAASLSDPDGWLEISINDDDQVYGKVETTKTTVNDD